jgi:hypothetical protein
MNWSLADLLALARLSRAAYLADSKEAVNALPGMTWIAQVGDLQCQATIARWGDLSVVCYRGTQVGKNDVSIPELFDDIEPGAIRVGVQGEAAIGVWQPMDDLWPEILKVLPAGQVLFTGHSLGGGRAQLSKAKIRSAEVVTFGAICCANHAFWSEAYGAEQVARLVHENDFAPAWSPGLFEDWCQPGPMAWLHNETMHEASERPDMLISILDPACVAAHSIDTGYIAALTKLAASPQSAAA